MFCAHHVLFSLTSAGVDLIAAFYGCLYAGVIPVTVRPPHHQNLAATLPTVRMIIDVSQCNVLSTNGVMLLTDTSTNYSFKCNLLINEQGT